MLAKLFYLACLLIDFLHRIHNVHGLGLLVIDDYLLNLIIDDRLLHDYGRNIRPAKCFKFRSQLSPAQADDSASATTHNTNGSELIS